MRKRILSLFVITAMLAAVVPGYAEAEGDLSIAAFRFGTSGGVTAEDVYTDEKGYGFTDVSAVTDEDSDVTGSADYTFKVKVENGNYTVAVDTTADSITSEVIETVTATTGITRTGTEFNVAVCDGVLDLTFPGGSTLSGITVASMKAKAERTKSAVYTIGDSTTNNKNNSLGTKSWGNCVADGDIALPEAFSAFKNNARGGRDSLKYYNDGSLETTLLDICPGDYVTVNMGINSSAGEWDAFETLISEYYVQAILDRGGIPVIVTATPAGPVGSFADAEYNSETGEFTNSRGDSCRNDVLRKIAVSKQLNIIELGNRFEDYFNSLTADDVTEYNTLNGTSYATVLELVQSWYADHNHYTQLLGEKIGRYMMESLAAIAAGSEEFSYNNDPYIKSYTETQIQIGEYLSMGTYYGEPILWRCVDIDENGPLMLSDKIICLKAYDAKTSENSATGSHTRDNENRSVYGSNYWADSNIRSWLNSNASAGNVNWLCGNPPDEAYVLGDCNDYADEAGFLKNFTNDEKAAIKEVTQNSLLSDCDKELNTKENADSIFAYNNYIGDILQNYDTAYSEQVTDRMFLPDVKQLNAVYKNSDILGENYYIGEPTANAVTHSEYSRSDLATGSKWFYWLRTPNTENGKAVRQVASLGLVNDAGAYTGSNGIRPAFYLNTKVADFKSGEGKEDAPYSIEQIDVSPTTVPTPDAPTGDDTPHTFYKQDYEEETDASSWSAMTGTTDYLQLITGDSKYGKYISYDLTQSSISNPRTAYTGISADISDEDFYVVEFDMASSGGEFMVANGDFSYSVDRQIYNSPDYIFDIKLSSSDDTAVLNDVETNTVTITKGEWYHYKLVVDKANKRVSATITDGDGAAVIENKLCPISADNSDISGLYFLSGRQTSMKADNIIVREKTEEDALGDTSDEAINTVSFSEELNKKLLITQEAGPQHHKIVLDIEGTYGTNLNQSADVEWSIVGAEKFADSISLTTEAGTGDGLDGDAPSGNVAYLNITDGAAGCIGYVRAAISYGGGTRTLDTPFAVYNGTENKGFIVPTACYPADMSDYADSLVGYVSPAVGADDEDIVLGGWSVFGSNPYRSLELKSDADGTKYMCFSSNNTQLRSTIGVYPLANQDSEYTVDMTVRFTGGIYQFGHYFTTTNRSDSCHPCWTVDYDNGNLKAGEQLICSLKNGEWYRIKVTADKSSGTYSVSVTDTDGAETGFAYELSLSDDASYSQRYFCATFEKGVNYPLDISSFKVYEASAVRFGKCGEKLEWELQDDGTLEITGSGTMFDFYEAADTPWYALRDQITNISIQGAKNIGYGAFGGLTELTEVSIPSTVNEINRHAFEGCSSLESVSIPISTMYIEPDVFEGCSESLVISGYSNSAAENYANENGITFNAVDADAEVTAEGEIDDVKWTVTSDGILRIGVKDNTGVFEDYIGLDDFEQGGAPWYGYRNDINSIIITDKMFTIGDYAFEDMPNLQFVSMPKYMSFISGNAFYSSSPRQISGYTNSAAQDYAEDKNIAFYSIGEKTASTTLNINQNTGHNENLEALFLTADLYTDGLLALSKNGNIESHMMHKYHFPVIVNRITIEDGPELIEDEALKDFHFISELTVPATVIRIGDRAFKDCKRLKAVTIPYNTMTIGENVFEGCGDDLVIKGYTNSAAQAYAEKNNIEFESIGTMPEIIIASGQYGSNASWELDSYGTLTISGEGDMEEIDSDEIPWRSYLDLISHIVIEDGITSVAPYAFDNAVNVKDVSLPDTVTKIQYCAFQNCKSLTAIEIPTSVSTLDNWCFADCTSLKTAVIPYRVTNIDLNTFKGHAEDFTIKGYEHSDAEKYASKNEIKFESLGVMPNTVLFSGKAGENITWTLDNYGLLSLTGSGEMSDNAFSEIPYEYRSLRIYKINVGDGITSISKSAFRNCFECTEVRLPDSLTAIKPYAFNSCSSLKSITIPEGVTEIGEYAFALCYTLPEVTIPEGVTAIEEGVFRGCDALASVRLSAETKSIGENTFRSCSALKRIMLPEGVTSIGEWAFSDSGLIEAALPDGVTYIGEAAFLGTHLTEINIGPQVNTIGFFALNSGDMREINVDEANQYYSSADGVLFSKDKTVIAAYPCEKEGETYDLPSTVTEIGDGAFGNSRIEKITIPRGVTKIGDFTFYECNSLTEVTIPGTVTNIGECAFEDCPQLKKINYIGSEEQWYNVTIAGAINQFPQELVTYSFTPAPQTSNIEWTVEDGVLTISGEGYMDDYTSTSDRPWNSGGDFTSIVIEEGITGIGDMAFYGLSNVTSVSLPEGLEYIGRQAFFYTRLAELTLPESLKYIGAQAFRRNQILSSLHIPENVEFIGELAFSYCPQLTTITVAEGNSNYWAENNVLFGRSVYDNTTVLLKYPADGAKKYTVPDDVVTIGSYAFENSDIEEITLNDGLEEIDSYAFSGCDRLKSITLPHSLYYIGAGAFQYIGAYGESIQNDEGETEYKTTYNINTITIPENVSDIGNGAFRGIQSIEVDADNNWYKSVDGVLFTKDGTELVEYPSRKAAESYTIPDTVTNIHSYAFAEAQVNSVIMPDSVTEMGIYCFDAASVESVRLSAGLDKISDFAFSRCRYLTSVTIPEGVTAIGNSAFRNCNSLEEITIPLSLKSIDNQAFLGCNALRNVYYSGTASQWAHGVEKSDTYANPYNANQNVQLHCSEITSGECGDNLTWSVNDGVLTISGSGPMVVEDEFNPPWKSNADNIREIRIEEGVTSIADRAFSVCYELNSITIPSTVTEIGELFTLVCSQLERITVSENSRSFKTDEDGVLFTYDGKTLIRYPAGLRNVYYNVTADVERIYSGAFAYSELQYVNYMENVSDLGAYAFDGCEELLAVDMPEVTELGDYTFANCHNLESIELPQGLNSIGTCAFSNCFSLTSVDIPEGTTTIGPSAFNSCRQLENVTIPDTVSGIGNYAFAFCEKLQRVQLPSALKEINRGIFYGATGMTIVHMPEGVTSIGQSAFYNCGSLKYADIPSTVTQIGKYAFWGCASLTYAEIPDGVTELRLSLFNRCHSLRSVVIPDSVEYIGDYAFRGCYNLKNVRYKGERSSFDDLVREMSVVDNECLMLANIRCKESEQLSPAISSANVIDNGNGTYTVTAELTNIPYKCRAAAALYKDNTLQGCGINTVKAAETGTEFTIPAGSIDTVKIFIWDSLNGLNPLCGEQTVTGLQTGGI